jgi:hypothetical protein
MKKIKEKKSRKPKKTLKSGIYTLIFLIVLVILGAATLYGLYYLLPYIKTYGETNSVQDKANIYSICATMAGFVLDYVFALLFMNIFFQANGRERFGVQNRLIIADVVLTAIVFGLVYWQFDEFRILASDLFTIRYFPNAYIYFVIPLVLVPNLLMVFYVDRYMHFSQDEDTQTNTVNMNSSVIDDPLKEPEKPKDVWTDEPIKEEEIKGAAEIVAEEAAKKPKEEVGHISIKTKEEMEQEIQNNRMAQTQKEQEKTLAEITAKTATGAQVFNGFDKPSVSSMTEKPVETTSNNPFDIFNQPAKVQPAPQPTLVVAPVPPVEPVKPVEPTYVAPQPVNTSFASSVPPTTVSNNNDTYMPPEGTNPHQFDAVNKNNLYPEKNPLQGNEGYQTTNYNQRLNSNQNSAPTTNRFINVGMDNSDTQTNNNGYTASAYTEPTYQTLVQPSYVEPTPVVPETPVPQAAPEPTPQPTNTTTSGEKTCPICGVHLPADATRCFMCGHKF